MSLFGSLVMLLVVIVGAAVLSAIVAAAVIVCVVALVRGFEHRNCPWKPAGRGQFADAAAKKDVESSG